MDIFFARGFLHTRAFLKFLLIGRLLEVSRENKKESHTKGKQLFESIIGLKFYLWLGFLVGFYAALCSNTIFWLVSIEVKIN